MKDEHKNFFNKRAFLNPRNGLAAAYASCTLEVNAPDKNGKGGCITADSYLTLTDCSRRIDLDFSVGNYVEDGKLSARRKKVATFRKLVNEFLDATEALYDAYEQKEKELKELRKQKGKK